MTEAERQLLLLVAEALIKRVDDDFGPTVQRLMDAIRGERAHTSSELGHG